MNPVLVEVFRGGVLESFHRGVICLVNEKGETIFSKGDANQLCYPRSAMKYLQVLPLLEEGGMEHFGFTPEEIAVMCGSHNGEKEHVQAVRSVLHKIGLDESYLQCGPQLPSLKKDADQLIREGLAPIPVHNNCSGKHAGMLAMCVLKQWPVQSYIHPDHPLQQKIREICALFYQYPADKMVTALDGCSAPIFSVPVYHQALGYMRLVNPAGLSENLAKACKRVISSISAHPFMVAGTKRYCTDMMRITAPGIIGKTGAEGIFCMGFVEQKLGVCIKIDDGKMQPQYNVAQALLENSGLFEPGQLNSLHVYQQSPVKNYNKLQTGEIKTVDGLFDGLKLEH